MRQRTSVLTLLLLGTLLWPTFAAAGSKVVLGTLNWEPYIGETLPSQGWVAEVAKEAFNRSGYTLEIRFRPWARLLMEAEKGKYDGYFPEYFAEKLKQHFLLCDPFKGGPLGFFKLKGKQITFNTLQDLKPFRIGIVRGYVNTAEFDAATFLQKDESVDDLENLKKLLAGRIDLMVVDKYTGMSILKKNMPEKLDQVEFLSPPLEAKELYVCISKKTADSTAKLEAFNKGLQSMLADGTFESIMKQHGF